MGIKVWARCGVSGMVYDFQVCTGAGSGSNNDNLGLCVGGNVVRHLTTSLPINVANKVYFNNCFPSVPPPQFLKSFGIWAVGTIRADRPKGAGNSFKDKKSLEKSGRGSSDWCVDAKRGITIVR